MNVLVLERCKRCPAFRGLTHMNFKANHDNFDNRGGIFMHVILRSSRYRIRRINIVATLTLAPTHLGRSGSLQTAAETRWCRKCNAVFQPIHHAERRHHCSRLANYCAFRKRSIREPVGPHFHGVTAHALLDGRIRLELMDSPKTRSTAEVA